MSAYRLICRLLGHDSYVCAEPECHDFGHRVCRRCGRWAAA
jgi:hypothetical protein